MHVLLTVAEVRERLRCGRIAVYKRIQSGALPAIHDGHRYLIAEDDLDAYIESLRVQPRPADREPTRRRRRGEW